MPIARKGRRKPWPKRPFLRWNCREIAEIQREIGEKAEEKQESPNHGSTSPEPRFENPRTGLNFLRTTVQRRSA